jgi:hypothetical protein
MLGMGIEYSACGGGMKMEAKLKTKQKQKSMMSGHY